MKIITLMHKNTIKYSNVIINMNTKLMSFILLSKIVFPKMTNQIITFIERSDLKRLLIFNAIQKYSKYSNLFLIVLNRFF